MPRTQPEVTPTPAVVASSWPTQLAGPGRIAASRMSTLIRPGNMSASFQVCRPMSGSMASVKEVMKMYVITLVSHSTWKAVQASW